MMLRFYGHFAAAYGTFWLVLLLLAIASGSSLNAGMFGLIGFPVLAFLYAIARSAGGTSELESLRRRVRELDARSGGRA